MGYAQPRRVMIKLSAALLACVILVIGLLVVRGHRANSRLLTMTHPDKVLIHADCGGTIKRELDRNRYICDRCHAEAESILSAGEKIEGRPEEVTLCNPHGQTI